MALLFMLLKNKIYQIESGWLIFFARMIISCLVMYFIVALMNIDMVLWRELDQVQRAVKLLLICTAAIISYAGILWISGLRIADLRR